MSKHTLGPWAFYTEPQPNGCPIVGARGLMVCMLAHTVNQPEQRGEALANARLIAAAPELLAIAQRVSEWERKYPAHRVYSDGKIRSIVAEMKAIVNDADAVIAKVEDRT